MSDVLCKLCVKFIVVSILITSGRILSLYNEPRKNNRLLQQHPTARLMATNLSLGLDKVYQSSTRRELVASADDNEADDETSSYTTQSDQKIFQASKFNVKLLVWFVNLLLFASVLTCLVSSKLTLIKIFADLHILSNFSNFSLQPNATEHARDAASLYWMLFFIVLVPNILSWIRALLSGLLSKSPRRPWPKYSAVFGCVVNASIEAIVESILVFYVFITLPPVVSLLLMCGVYSTQSLFRTAISLNFLCKRGCSNYTPIESSDPLFQVGRYHHCFVVFITVVGFLCQAIGLICVATFLIIAYTEASRNRIPGIVLAVPCLIILSLAWSGLVQKSTFKPSERSITKARKKLKQHALIVTARWKGSFVATSVRLIIYPIVSYCIFRYMYKLHSGHTVDPWVVSHNSSLTITGIFRWNHFHIAVFSVHIITSFLAYVLSWLACYMTLHVFGLALPIFFATPISLVVYFLSNSSLQINNAVFVLFPFQVSDASILDWKSTLLSHWYIYAFGFGFLLLFGQLLTSGFKLFRAKNAILASEESMFVRPYYNSVFLEQSLAINRDVSHKPQVQMDGNRNPCVVFICSTMFRENAIEMRQMLRSIKRVAKFYQKERDKRMQFDRYESHIFFDGGCREDELSAFAIQLMSLVPDALDVTLTNSVKQKTPYGYRFSWNLNQCMPFVVHLKDNHKVRNKKRWSQVMYMNYILNYRSEKESLDLNSTFVLTTDADIDFKAESALVLLDMLARDPQVGAVCSRTHPQGSGPLYWYQIFDYAIGHWLQKSAEHILGSVLCCPGCFSIFRCSALQDCLPTYSSEVSDAMEFLTKDMGEDRWLCTLMVENGWKLEYCAISNDYTYCPNSFDEFFKQRRRWIPSTVANLWLLISKASKITAKNESVTWGFILYQIIVIISTIISPATVILIIASGLTASFGLNSVAVIVALVFFAVLYGVICVFANQKIQLDTAKILTFIFSVVMAVVIVGIIKETVEDVLAPFKGNVTNSDDDDVAGIRNAGKVPIAESTIYIALFAFVFVITAVLHFFEGFALFHCLWYLLGLPSGYLLLLIYSTANLNDRRWGTREAKDKSQQSMMSILQQSVKTLIFTCLRKTKATKNEIPVAEKSASETNQQENEPPRGLEEPEFKDDVGVPSQKHMWLMNWLKNNQSEQFYDNFTKEGYTEEWFVSSMTRNDLVGIGVHPTGYVHHLEKAIKKLPQTPVKVGLPRCIEEWIAELKFGSEQAEYIEKFHMAGYYGYEDVENLIHITPDELKDEIGIKKKAHVKRFMEGIQRLKIRNEDEERIAEAEMLLQVTNDDSSPSLDESELDFWRHLTNSELKPTPEGLMQVNELRSDLKFLRNYALISMMLINLMWLILLSVFTFSELQTIGLTRNILGLLFLAVYGILLSIQFVGMLLHRTVTLAHYIARLNQSLPIEHTLTVTARDTTFF